MYLRNYVFWMCGVFLVVFHLIWIMCYTVESTYFNWLRVSYIPILAYVLMNVTAFLGALLLIYGTLMLKPNILLFWIVYMALLCHIPVVLYFVNLIMHNVKGNVIVQFRSRTLEGSNSLNPYVSGLVFGLWTCIWMLSIIKVYQFYITLKEFLRFSPKIRASWVMIPKKSVSIPNNNKRNAVEISHV